MTKRRAPYRTARETLDGAISERELRMRSKRVRSPETPIIPGLARAVADRVLNSENLTFPLPGPPDVIAVIEGEPQSKGRPRITRRGAYTPKGTQAAEELVRAGVFLGRTPDRQIIAEEALLVSIDFYSGTRQRRDIDNMAKLVLDACNGFLWKDDDQICGLYLTKHHQALTPRTELRVWILPILERRSCPECGKQLALRGPKSVQRYCSKPCYDHAQQKGAYVLCAVCQKRIYRQREKLDSYPNHYCSVECKRWAQTDRPLQRTALGTVPRNGPMRPCAVCGTLFNSRSGTCSRSCGAKLRRLTARERAREAKEELVGILERLPEQPN